MLLADGQNDCGDVGQALATLQASGIIFRHETVGFGITPTSPAATDLRHVATQTGGTYHHAADATQLADVFMEFVEHLQRHRPARAVRERAGSPSAPSGSLRPRVRSRRARDDGLTGLLGGFRVPERDATPSAYAVREPPATTTTTLPWRHRHRRVGTSNLEKPGYFGFGWHTGVGPRRRDGRRRPSAADRAVAAYATPTPAGLPCGADASGSPWRTWRDRDEDPERTYVVTSSSFRNLIARDLRSRVQERPRLRREVRGHGGRALLRHRAHHVRAMSFLLR